MPIMGGGGGGGAAFNGGTITNPLKVDSPTTGTALIEIDTPGHAGDNAFTVVDDLGAGVVTLNDQGNANLVGALGVGGNSTLGGITNTTQVYLSAHTAQSFPILQLFDKLGATPFQLDKDGYVLLAPHAAPADAALAAGECALWFDQTNGAAKLMVKAKTANGTVATAAIALA